MPKIYKLLINGKLINTDSHFDIINPTNGRIFASAPSTTKELADDAISCAHKAFQSWKNTDMEKRKQCLSTAKDIFKSYRDELAILLVKEQGKTLGDAYGEIDSSCELFENNLTLTSDTNFYKGTDTHTVYSNRVPLGVCLLITPWNYPIFTAVQKLCPAIVLGNTVILKPSPFTPLTSLRLGEIFKDVFPEGVFNVLTGADEETWNDRFHLASYLTTHPKIAKISFTGSTNTGRKIMMAATSNFKRITLEMGGNDAAIVREDVNISEVSGKILKSAFANTAALCCAIKRVYVQENIYEKFVEEIVKQANLITLGDGFDDVDYGPINNKLQLERGMELVKDAITHNAKIECGGFQVGEVGYFYKPTIITGVKEGVRIVDEEQFFPALPILSYKTDEEAIQRANDTNYGLGGSVWSSDISQANKLAAELRVGTSWVNDHSSLTGGEFGGRVGFSGFGRELGKADLYAFTESQTFMVPKIC